MSSRLLVSIFNDVIGPVMREPSSSHRTIRIETVDTGDEHPNTYRLTLHDLRAFGRALQRP